MSKSLRVIHILRAPVGGLFRHVRDLAIAQSAAGHSVGVVADTSTGDRLTDQRLDQLAPALALGLHRVAMSRDLGVRDVTATFAIARILSGVGATIVHGHGAKGGAYSRLASRLIGGSARPRAFYTPHGGSLHYAPSSLKGRVYMALERSLAPWTEGVVFESAYSARLFHERIAAPGLRSRVVPNGVSLGEFEPVITSSTATEFLFVGELRLLKGVDCLIDAIAAIRAAGHGVTATIVGDGPDRAQFIAQAQALGLGETVKFPGAMPARQAFALGRVLIVPSRAESFPYIVLEGAAAGLPLIATNVGGIPEIIAGTDHPLVRPGDVAGLARAMQTALDDLKRGGGMLQNEAQRLRAVVKKNFTIQTMAGAIGVFYLDTQPATVVAAMELTH